MVPATETTTRPSDDATKPTPSSPQSDRHVHYERLFEARGRSLPSRVIARIVCHTIVGCFHAATAFLRRFVGRSRAGKPVERRARIVLTGTFFADSWLEAHVRPLAASPYCEHVWVVSDRPFVPMENVTYTCPPRWLQRLIRRVPARSFLFVITAIRRRADVVGGFHLLVNGLLALLTASLVGAKSMYFCVGGWAEVVRGGVHGGNRLFTMIDRDDMSLERKLLRAVRRFDLILTMGTGARTFLLDRGARCPVEVMSGGIDSTKHAPADRTPTYDLITVSRIAPVKRLDIFLEVVRKVADTVPTVTALIVGDGEELASLKEQAQRLGIADRVTFAGRQRNVERWLADARLFVLTSDSEGLSLAVMEAAMTGLPSVVSDVGDLGDLVCDGVNGFRPPPRAVDQFAARITELLTDQTLYRRFAHASRESALRHSVEATRHRWMDILDRLGFGEMPDRQSLSDRRFLDRVSSRHHLWRLSNHITNRKPARVLSLVPPRVWLGGRFRRKHGFLRSAERWSKDETAAYQMQELRRVITIAYERSPYYRRVFCACGFEPGDLRALSDVAALPTIRAETVRDHLDAMSTTRWPTSMMDVVSTAGTNGKPLHFYINSDRSTGEYAHLIASWERVGYDLDQPLVVLRGRVIRLDRQGRRYEFDPLLRHHHFSALHLNDEHMQSCIECVRSVAPCFLHVYPSSVAALARFLRRMNGQALTGVQGVIAESEVVYPEQRRFVEETLGCRYFSCYGQTEKVVMAAECEHTTDYHVWPTYGFFELLADEGHPVTEPGQRGEIVGTGFTNTVVPFIRYRTGDYATYVADACEACGRNHVCMTDIRSHRTQEVLVAADGSMIPWVAVNMHDSTFEFVRQFQFYQDTPGRAILRIDPVDGFKPEMEQRILANLRAKLDTRLELRIERCSSIRTGPRGKAIYVDQRIPDVNGAAP